MSTHSTKLVDPRAGTDPGHRPSPFRFRYTPRLEWLEDRTVPTTLPGSLFEIDGNLVIDKAGNFDWANAPGLLTKPDAPTGQSDDALGQGAKEDTAVPSVVDGSIPNNKSDLTQFYFAQEAVGGKVFLYLAWERANTLGTANIDFEFNQSVEPSGNGVTPVRTPGDLLITFDFANGGKSVVLGVRKWQASGVWGPATALTSNVAVGAVNDPNAFGVGAVTDPLTGQALAEGTFGEAAINLTAADVFPPGECLHFGRAYVKSRSADSFSAELKDFIAPLDVNIDICSSIGDFVWHDLDGDGVQDASEPGIAGVTLTLTGTTIDNVPVSRTVTTDANGYYLFEELVAGKYTVAIDGGNFLTGAPLAGFTPTAALQGGDVARDSSTSPVSVVLDYEEDNLTNDFGFYKVAGIGDFVWEDADGDGVQDSGETGIAGVVVTLTGTTGVGATVSQSMTTDADGYYLFGDLVPGSYAVSFTAPTGYEFTAKDQGGDDTADSDASATGTTSSVVLTSGQSDRTRDAGLYRPVSIGDYVWEDKDGDGVQDASEPGIGGVVVTLTGTTGAGVTVSRSMTTAADGSYVFDGLAPGSYAVSFTAPTGFVFTAPDQGSDAADSDADATGGTGAVTLASGAVNMTRDAGLYRLASLGDFVWLDADGDGVQDGGEKGIGGVQITLTGTTGSNAPVSRTTTTAADGSYVFDGLAPGSYAVSFAAPTGFVFTAPDQGSDAADSDADATGGTGSVTLASGAVNMTRDAGLYRLASLGDFVWLDADGDGVQDSGEPGIGGVVVTLTGTTGANASVSRTATTAADGSYVFDGLAPGSYAVSFAAPGYEFTAKDQGSDDATDSDADAAGGTDAVTLVSGESNRTRDAGLYRHASLGDFVWEDGDGDGVQDAGEPGISGVKVTLTGTTGSGATVNRTATTDASGLYQFDNLIPGSYAVTFAKPDGYVFTTPDQGGDDAADSDADASGVTGAVVLASGSSDQTRDAGLYRPASLGDFVWVDSDGDGVQDAGEAGVAGVVVSLTGTTGTGAKVSQSMSTDASGSYLFGNLAPGSYAVSFTAPTGYGFTAQDQGSDAADSDADAAGGTEAVTLASGASNLTRDAGLYQTVSIGDFVWVDRNGNGVQDTGEPGIGGVQVSLTGTAATGAKVSETATTDTNGSYLFGNLVPGSYAVSFTAPTGYVFTAQDVGGDTTDSDANVNGVTDAVTLTSGQTDLTRDAGLYQLASVGDFVWEDADGDGVQDASEAGIAGVGVTLTGTTGAGAKVSRTATTDANGYYLFGNLVPGSYAVSFTAPGYVFTAKDRGNDDAADSDADVNGDTGTITLTSGESDLTRDAGLYRLAVLGDYVWEDADGDGVQEGGENGIAGVKVTLTGTTGINTPVSRETTTDANGYYQFANLAPGSYAVNFAAPAGYVFTAPDLGPDGKDSDADADGDTDAVVLTSGGSDLTRDAGLYKLAGLGDFVWDDLNGNGVQNAGEMGIAGVQVTLAGTTGTGASVLTTATTDANGYYLFGNLIPGSYSVSFKAPTGYVFTAKDQGGNDATDSDATATGTTDAVTLTSGQSDTTRDAGLYRPVSIGDFVWDDLNGNGVQDSGEAGLQGVTVKLLRAGVELAATTTGPGGAYLFANLVPGTYAVSFTAPSGTVFTAPNVGSDAADSDADANGGTTDVTLKSGDSDLTRDAGLYRPVSLGDFVWEDADGDGVQDAGEAGIAGAKVTLTGKSGTGSNVTLDTTTDGNGFYQFVSLVPGTYAVSFEAPTGYKFTAQDQLLDDAADSDADATGATAAVTLKSGDSDSTRDAGLYRPAAVGNFAWLDASAAGTNANSTGILSGPGVGTNVNGIQDIGAGEAGIQGVKVTLHGWTGAGVEVTRTAYTDASGYYQFTDLAPGSYTATFTPLAGQVITARDQGADDAMDSDADPATGATVPITLVSGQDDTTLDAGIKPIDLSLTKVVVSPQEHYAAGDPITYLITVSNASGFSTATGVQVTDHLPADLVFVSATPSQGSFSVVSGIWDVGTLVGGASATLTIVATPAAPPVLEGVEGSGTLYGSLFEIDGNLTADHGGQLDWANVAYQVQQDIANRQKDDAFGKGAKEDTAVPVVVDGSIPKNKSDLTRFLFSQEVVSGRVFLYLAWERANTLGTANIDFEFNQSTQVSDNGETPVRTPGDILITFDFASGGNVVELGLRKWLATGEWGQPTALGSGVAIGAVNDKLTFGEAAINLTDTGLFPPDECLHFGSAFVKSRSSDAFTSELKDFIAPMPVNVETCAEVTNRAEVTRADQRDDDSTPGNSLLLLSEDDEAAAGATILLSSGGATAPAVGGAMLPTVPLTEAMPTDTGLAVDGTTEGHAVTVSGVAPPLGAGASSDSAGAPGSSPVAPAGGGSHDAEPGDVPPPARVDLSALANGVFVGEQTGLSWARARRWQTVIALDPVSDDLLAAGVFGPYVGG